MKVQTLQLFRDLGIKEEKIKEIESKDSFEPKDLFKDIKDNIYNGAAADENFRTPIKKQGSGEAFQIVNKAIKNAFGLQDSDVKDKSIEDLLEVVKSKSRINGDKANTDLELLVSQKNKEIESIRNVEIPQIKSELERVYHSHLKKDKIRDVVSSFQLAAGDPKTLSGLVKEDIENRYDIAIDDSNDWGLKIRTKGTNLPIYDANGTKEYTPADIVQQSLIRLKLLQQNNVNYTPPKPLVEESVNKNQTKPDGTKVKNTIGYNSALSLIEEQRKHYSNMQ